MANELLARLVVEDCERFDVQREIFRSRRLRFNAVTEGTWKGLRWRVLLSETGSFIEMDGGPDSCRACRRWELVPHGSSSPVDGVRWYFVGSDGRRVTSLFLTPDGRLGTRWELGLKYKSQRLWTRKRLAWARLKVIVRLEGPTEFGWVRSHPDHLPGKPKWMKQARYRRLRRKLVRQALCRTGSACSPPPLSYQLVS
jgi:hypothetical protein